MIERQTWAELRKKVVSLEETLFLKERKIARLEHECKELRKFRDAALGAPSKGGETPKREKVYE